MSVVYMTTIANSYTLVKIETHLPFIYQ